MTEARPFRVGLVCLGNICRSPMAAVVLAAKVRDAGLDDRIVVGSSGTGDWHIGEPMDPRAAAQLKAQGYDGSGHRAKQFDARWFDAYDLLLAMDDANATDLRRQARNDSDRQRIRRFRDFDPLATDDDRSVPDPWYGDSDGFEEVFAIVERTANALVETLRRDPQKAVLGTESS
ncbi:MAG: low molecular weight protein-tyrosine-phosphatase [Nocardioidaceae bacterium]